MCRFTFYRGEPLTLAHLITEPVHSLIHQSYHSEEREEPLNGDGFGLAWYVEGTEEPAVFRAVTPAWSNRNLRELARVTKSYCLLAHVRAATQALEVSETNCHPFKDARYALMHNGDVAGFHAIRRAMDLSAEHAPGEPSYLNLVVSDGESAIACRYVTDAPENAESLYVARGRYVWADGAARILPAERGEGAVLVSSERLGADPAWQQVPVGWWLMIAPDLEVSYRPMRVGPGFDHPDRTVRA